MLETEIVTKWGERGRPSLAQVVPILGAGEVLGWGPAPQNGALLATVAQVQPFFPHLRHRLLAPAPQTPTSAPLTPYTYVTSTLHQLRLAFGTNRSLAPRIWHFCANLPPALHMRDAWIPPLHRVDNPFPSDVCNSLTIMRVLLLLDEWGLFGVFCKMLKTSRL